MESIKARKGIVTATILIFISGLLVVILLFDESTLHFFLARQMQRKHYVERTLTLQKMTSIEKQNVCKNLPLDNSEKARQISITLDGANDAIQYSLWCRRVAIFKKTPTKGVNQGLFDHFIRMENLSEFRPHFLQPANPLVTNKMPQIYWFDQHQTTWEINGKVQGIVIAEGDLTLRGNGRISGTVITAGTLTLEGVTVAYGKKVIEPLVRQYSKWQLAEKSWSDFKISSE